MDIYGWTSRGPLQLMVLQALVQWFATRRRAQSARARCAWRLVWRHVSNHELFEVVFACAWWAKDVANGSGAVGVNTGVGVAAGVGSVA